MNKSDLVAEAQKIAGGDVSKATVERIVNAVLAAIKDGVKEEGNVQLVGFGTFSVATRAERTGVNPRTKEKILIPGKKVVRFKPGAEFSRAV